MLRRQPAMPVFTFGAGGRLVEWTNVDIEQFVSCTTRHPRSKKILLLSKKMSEHFGSFHVLHTLDRFTLWCLSNIYIDEREQKRYKSKFIFRVPNPLSQKPGPPEPSTGTYTLTTDSLPEKSSNASSGIEPTKGNLDRPYRKKNKLQPWVVG